MIKDERTIETQKEFPLRVIPLNLCICGHDNKDHQTEYAFTKVQDGACEICICSRFYPLVAERRKKK